MGRKLNVRFPEQLKNQIERKAENEHRTQSSVVKEAVGLYFSGASDE